MSERCNCTVLFLYILLVFLYILLVFCFCRENVSMFVLYKKESLYICIGYGVAIACGNG